MSTRSGTARLAIVGSLLAALVLSILPLPWWAAPYRPQWVALVLIFWCFNAPDRVGVLWAFVTGIALDVLSGSLLGQHALGLSVIAYLALQLRRRVLPVPPWQQAITVWLLLLLERLLALWIHGVSGQPTPSLVYWAATIVGMLLWPWLWWLLRRLQARSGMELLDA
ncbi:rod shape-determining protein MreD [Thiohalocapsa marina]|uniref:rod shape-determining protein MreD n=1 Tax=Thiohalocapsa marina TaxID=424902 RepID=UPI001FE68026|nr:rod shape-determining protein MreD [Thiohalocapsa marina]